MSRIGASSFIVAAGTAITLFSVNAFSDPLPPDLTYRPLPMQPFSEVKVQDEAMKPAVMQRQRDLLSNRYDIADHPMDGVMMSGGMKPVQAGVRVKLPEGVTWASLATMKPAEIREKNLLPEGFLPLPHVKQATGGQVFPQNQIDQIAGQERRDLKRFDVDFDLPIISRPNSRHRSSSPRIPNSETSRAASC
jgi:hypothetical protein